MNLKRVLFISLYNSVFYVTFELSPTWLTWSWIFENVMCKKQIIFSLFSSFSILQYFFLLSCAMFLWNWTFCVLPLSYLVHGIFFRFLRALQRLVFSQYSGYDFFGFYLKNVHSCFYISCGILHSNPALHQKMYYSSKNYLKIFRMCQYVYEILVIQRHSLSNGETLLYHKECISLEWAILNHNRIVAESVSGLLIFLQYTWEVTCKHTKYWCLLLSSTRKWGDNITKSGAGRNRSRWTNACTPGGKFWDAF